MLAHAYPITSYLEMVKVSGVGSTWQTLLLSNSYSNPVVACTYNLPSFINSPTANSNEAAVRVQVIGSSVQIKIQKPLSLMAVSTGDVYCTVSEEGSYTYPIKYEAHLVTSPQTNYGGDWTAATSVNVTSSKVQTYSDPAIIGQVMSYNNPNFSVFWSHNCSNRGVTATNSSICVGKHTGQSVPTAPTSETLGYFIAESGTYIQASSTVTIDHGSNSIAGVGDSPPYSYSLPSNHTYATASQAAENGGNGGWVVLYGSSPVSSSLNLAIEEETVAGDTTRRHTNEQVDYWVMEPISKTYANLRFNEVLYRQSGGVLREFIEFYVISDGTLLNYMVSSQDGLSQNYRMPDVDVNAGDYVIFHSNTGSTSSSGGVVNIYSGSTSTPLQNTADDIVLLKPSDTDATVLNGSGMHNVIPVDYIAYGTGGSIDPVPTSINSVTVSWNSVDGSRLGGASPGESISLTPNGVDTNTSVCWERTNSGDASTCASYIITSDTDPSAFINSRGENNNIAPELSLSKSVLTIYDPYNGASNPKAIPGSVIEYSIDAENNGPLAADNNSINLSDVIPDNTKLCVVNLGNCRAPYFVNGTPSSGLALGTTSYSNNNGASYGYSASADAEGADSSVTNLSTALNGAFAAKTGAIAPSFSIKFRVVVE